MNKVLVGRPISITSLRKTVNCNHCMRKVHMNAELALVNNLEQQEWMGGQ